MQKRQKTKEVDKIGEILGDLVGKFDDSKQSAAVLITKMYVGPNLTAFAHNGRVTLICAYVKKKNKLKKVNKLILKFYEEDQSFCIKYSAAFGIIIFLSPSYLQFIATVSAVTGISQIGNIMELFKS